MFHSSPKSIRSYQKDVLFLMVGDPKKTFYKGFGVEASLGFLNLKALGAGMRGMAHGHFGLRLAPGGPLGLPADFLIAPSGRINAVKYGTDAYDQWSVDELLTLAKGVAAQALLRKPPCRHMKHAEPGQASSSSCLEKQATADKMSSTCSWTQTTRSEGHFLLKLVVMTNACRLKQSDGVPQRRVRNILPPYGLFLLRPLQAPRRPTSELK